MRNTFKFDEISVEGGGGGGISIYGEGVELNFLGTVVALLSISSCYMTSYVIAFLDMT